MTLIINDLHAAVQRTGGTTPQSAQALKKMLRDRLAALLEQFTGEHVMVNGDCFDRFEVETSEVIELYEVFSNWLCSRLVNKLTLIMGNHDASAKGNRVSSFHLLSHFLTAQYPQQFRMIDHDTGFCEVEDNVHAISHQMNQELFEIEVDKAVDGKGKYLLLHCNVKNTFAEHSDHSLNLTDTLLAKLMLAGWTLVVGHEHQGYELRGGRIIVVGNQFPSSIADCIGEKEKRAIVIDGEGHRFIKTWDAAGSYVELDWRALTDYVDDGIEFIRVTGDATADEAADVINLISKFRQKSDALVITNAVKIDGVSALDEITSDGVEEIKSFDVLGAILEHLNEEEAKTVRGLLA